MNDGIYNPLLLWTGTPFLKISRHRLIDLDKPSLLIDDMELVLVHQLVIPSTQLTDRLIMLVHNGDVPVAMAVPSVVVTLKTEENVLSLPASSLEVGGPDAVQTIARPNKVAVVSEDVRTCLTWTMLFSRRVWVASKGSHKEISRFDLVRGRDGDVETRRCQVRTGAKLPVSRSERRQDQRGSSQVTKRVLHVGDEEALLAASASRISISPKKRYIHLDAAYEPKVHH